MRFQVEEAGAGRRLDVFLSENTELTRSRLEKLIKGGSVLVEDKVEKKPSFALKAGQWVELEVPEIKEAKVEAENIPLPVVYQDDDLAVVFKPSGMVVHPAAGNPSGTMVNALLYHLSGLSGIGGEMRPGIVHRIDKDTSGLLLVAKNDRSHLILSEQIKAHSMQRAYLAIVLGGMKQDEGDIEGPIGRHPTDRKKMAIVPGGREAHTHFRVLERLNGACLIEARLTTGRTHQIRVHMASIGHPVAGDPVYGPKKGNLTTQSGQLLHAYKLGFVHPADGRALCFEAAPEAEFMEILNKLRPMELKGKPIEVLKSESFE